MRAPPPGLALPAVYLLSAALALPACGGKAVVEGAAGVGGAGGAGATSTSFVATSTDSTSVSTGDVSSSISGCSCSDDGDCPDPVCASMFCDGCQCVEKPFPPGDPCPEGVCDGNGQCVACITAQDCPPGATCVASTCVGGVTVTCESACEVVEPCLGTPRDSCMMSCLADLTRCNDDELTTVEKCTELLAMACDAEGWIDCMQSIPCVDI